jgi:orotidine-5'-phosphate decarboxylase
MRRPLCYKPLAFPHADPVQLMTSANPIFVAIDRPDLDGALALARALEGEVGGIKLGLEFWGAQGPAGVRALAELGLPVFLDLKLHDIPNTVAGALKALLPLGLRFVTLHASGGPAMLRAAAEAVAPARQPPTLLAVTVLTSLDAGDLESVGMPNDPSAQALRLARLAQASGIGGVVCSPLEIAAVRAACPAMTIATPGIRPRGTPAQDQKRIMAPDEALAAGADILVVGRPITHAPDPRAAARRLKAGLRPASPP